MRYDSGDSDEGFVGVQRTSPGLVSAFLRILAPAASREAGSAPSATVQRHHQQRDGKGENSIGEGLRG